jgi:hypothetical protein
VHFEEQVLREDDLRGCCLGKPQEAKWRGANLPNNASDKTYDSMNYRLVLKAPHGSEFQGAEHLLYRGGSERLFVSEIAIPYSCSEYAFGVGDVPDANPIGGEDPPHFGQKIEHILSLKMLQDIEETNDVRACRFLFVKKIQTMPQLDARNPKSSCKLDLLLRTIHSACVAVTRLMKKIQQCAMPAADVQNPGIAARREVVADYRFKESPP